MSTKNDTTRLLDIQELIVLDTEIKEDEVILNRKNRFDYTTWKVNNRIEHLLPYVRKSKAFLYVRRTL